MKSTVWNINNIPDQKDKIVIVTGSSSGIGYEAAKVLADKNAAVIIAVRNREKGERAIQRIKEANTDARVELMLIDLADQQSIKNFTEEFRNKYDRLDLLINNAGVMIPPYSKTKDGFELQFGTNHLGHFALTGLLLDIILKTKQSRIVNVSSGAHRYGNINFDDLNWEKRKYRKWVSYGDSKIANLYFTYELQRKFEENQVNTIVTAAHPGVAATELQRHSRFIDFLTPLVAMKSKQGALPTLRAAVDEAAQSGDYFGPDGFQQMRGFPVKVRSNKLSHDKAIAKKLWDVSEELTGVKYQF
jgi:NAD(P)-dependent dehydrogenase (short-subunit alcohol dehydrogenase family)